MKKFLFYYDETEHSRKLNENTINSDNYSDVFWTVILGWESKYQNEMIKKYEIFSKKYEKRKDKNGEIKSTQFSSKEFEYGFNFMKKSNISLISDFLDLFDDNVKLFISNQSKMEYIITQIFKDYFPKLKKINENIPGFVYSIVKSLITYKPKKVINLLFKPNGHNEFIDSYIRFLEEKNINNCNNVKLKQSEIYTFNIIIYVLEKFKIWQKLNNDFQVSWDYSFSFYGFINFLNQKTISLDDVKLFIDREGSSDISPTSKSAKKMGLDAEDVDSIKNVGIQMSDMLVGIVSKMSKALKSNISKYNNLENPVKQTLNHKWFARKVENNEKIIIMEESVFLLYKKLHKIICNYDVHFKSFTSIYFDDFLHFISLLSVISSFETYDDFKLKWNQIPEMINTYYCERSKELFYEFNNINYFLN